MGNGNRITDLRKRFDLLPLDLTELYRKMIQNLDPFYLEHAAQLFTLVGASREPMNLLLAAFVDEEDPRFALRMEAKALSDREIDIRMDTIRRRINSRSRGLLEVKGGTSTPQGISYDASSHKEVTAQYLHRTVKDFVKSSNVQQTLSDALKTPFDPHVRLLAGQLAYLKSIDANIAQGSALDGFVKDCFFNARVVEAQSTVPMIHLLNNLDRVCASIAKYSFLLHLYNDRSFGGTFLSLAVACNVVEFVRAKATGPCLTQRADQNQWPLLMDALQSANALFPTRENYKATIEVLLEKKADPKYEIICKTRRLPEEALSPLAKVTFEYVADSFELDLIAVQLLSRGNTYDSSTPNGIILAYFDYEGFIYPSRKRLEDFLARRSIKKVIGKAVAATAKGNPPHFVEIWRQLVLTHKLTEVEAIQPGSSCR